MTTIARPRIVRTPSLQIDSTNRAELIDPPLIEYAAALHLASAEWGDIDLANHFGRDLVYCGHSCAWHEDRGIADYTALLVVRNDAGSKVQVKSSGRFADMAAQPIGTFLVLDVRRLHRLGNARGRTLPTNATWAAVAINYHVRPNTDHRRRFGPNEFACDRAPTLERAWADMERYLKRGDDR